MSVKYKPQYILWISGTINVHLYKANVEIITCHCLPIPKHNFKFKINILDKTQYIVKELKN